MGVAYAPFGIDEHEPPSLVRAQKPAAHRVVVRSDTTECNYLVLFFIVGVFLLSIV